MGGNLLGKNAQVFFISPWENPPSPKPLFFKEKPKLSPLTNQRKKNFFWEKKRQEENFLVSGGLKKDAKFLKKFFFSQIKNPLLNRGVENWLRVAIWLGSPGCLVKALFFKLFGGKKKKYSWKKIKKKKRCFKKNPTRIFFTFVVLKPWGANW